MIYIFYIIYCDNVATCVLIVRDNKHSVKDDDDMSSEVAEERARAGRSHGWAQTAKDMEWDTCEKPDPEF